MDCQALYPCVMKLLLDSFWRAVMYCLHPRVIALSILPLVLMAGVAFGLGYFFWDPALEWVREGLESSSLISTFWGWLQSVGAGNLKTVVAPLIVIFSVTPVLVLLCLLVVAVLMTPALTALVVERRFPRLERKKGSSFFVSLLWSLGSTALALIAMVISVPLWLVPPLILVLPPLIWGWLTYRVMAFDVLAGHASKQERREIFKRHRVTLLAMGVITGYLGAAPSVVWASGAMFAAAFVILVPVAIWMYTLVFAFASLWFAHFGLAALENLRLEAAAPLTPLFPFSPAATAVADVQALPLPDVRNSKPIPLR